jgi:trimeric autotransporter adhesin
LQVRFAIPVACLVVAALRPIVPLAQTAPACSLSGTIASTRIPLPGVVVSLLDADGRALDVSASGTDGTYALKIPGPGRYTLKAEFVAFAPLVRQLTVDPSGCQQRLDLTMTLASRVPQTGSVQTGPDRLSARTPAAPAAPSAPTGRGGRGGGRQDGRGQAFQSLALVADEAGLARAEDATGGTADSAAQVLLPPGFSPETSAESVTAIGASQAPEGFFGANGPGDFADRFANGFGDGGGFNAAGAAAGPGGGGVGRGGFGPGGAGPGGPFGRGGRGNQIRGAVFQSADTSALDTAPFALNNQPSIKPDYLQQRFGATIGGPLVIPKVINSPRTFFFVNYTGNHSSNPFDAYSTVPSAAERGGDLSAISRAIVDPLTGVPFVGNQIPASRLDPATQNLLALIPLPNQAGDRQNFHAVTTTASELDDVNIRLVRTFGAAPQGRGRGGGGRGGGFGGGRGGPGAGRAGVSNLNVTIHYRHADTTSANPFPALGGESTSSAWDVPASYSFTKAGMTHAVRLQFNRQHAAATNAFAFAQNIAGNAGLLGIASDPFDWGAPNLSLSSFTSVRDSNPSSRTDRTLAVGDTIVKTRGRQTLRAGGDYRDIRAASRTDANARGSYVFTGLFSGSDFSDLLLGLPQQASVQFGPGTEQFRSHSADLFIQDDWRATDTLTVNAGLRYEYFSPLSEASNRLVTLDVAPGFTAAVPVVAGGIGPYSGALASTIVNPFRTGLAPRVGVAWRPQRGTVVRAGYGINYNSSVYQSIAQQLAGQPPFAVTDTVFATPAAPLPLESALLAVTPGVTTNSYAVDPNYRLGDVQIWNLDVQRDLTRTLNVGVGYTGTKGSNLDILRAPNRDPNGTLRIAGVQPFIWESSEGASIMHAVTFRVRKRLTHGIAAGATYTLSRSIDDASSIGGGPAVVAQNDLDLAAERGLSSFDQRHRVSGNFTWELPFGADRRWFNTGMASALFGGWQLNGNLSLASGTPFTARVLGDIRDVARGTNGTLRANYNGQPIALDDPSSTLFFNTAAFSVPAAGTFGNAGRNTIIGPGTSVMNLGITRNLTWGQTRGLSIQLLANNLFNTVQFAAIDTIVNSPTFGQVTSVRPMRRIQLLTRFRF